MVPTRHGNTVEHIDKTVQIQALVKSDCSLELPRFSSHAETFSSKVFQYMAVVCWLGLNNTGKSNLTFDGEKLRSTNQWISHSWPSAWLAALLQDTGKACLSGEQRCSLSLSLSAGSPLSAFLREGQTQSAKQKRESATAESEGGDKKSAALAGRHGQG